MLLKTVNHFILHVHFLYLFLQWNSEHDFFQINSYPLLQAIIALGGSKKIRLPYNQGPLVNGPTDDSFCLHFDDKQPHLSADDQTPTATKLELMS